MIHELQTICSLAFAVSKPTKTDRNIRKVLESLIEFSKTMTKHQSRNISAREKQILDSLDKMCEIISIDIENQIVSNPLLSERKKKVDLYFLKDQRSHRRMEISEKEDPDYQKRVLENLENQLASDVQITENEPVVSILKSLVHSTRSKEFMMYLSSQEEEIPDNDNDEDESFEPSRFTRENRPTNSQRKSNSVIKDKDYLATLDRTKISSRNATMLTGSVLGAHGVDISNQTLSRSAIDRERKKMREEEANKIRASFQPPKWSVVHFDGKILEDLGGNLGDYLAVMLSGLYSYHFL